MGQSTRRAAGGWPMVHPTEARVGLVSAVARSPLCLPRHQPCVDIPFGHSGLSDRERLGYGVRARPTAVQKHWSKMVSSGPAIWGRHSPGAEPDHLSALGLC